MADTALRMLEFYPEWAAGQDYTDGYKVRHGGKLWRVVQAHTSQTGWEPSTATASLWEEICETHDGTLADPIPYDGNMALTAAALPQAPDIRLYAGGVSDKERI